MSQSASNVFPYKKDTKVDLISMHYDAIGIEQLNDVLRKKITEFQTSKRRGSGYRALSAAIEEKACLLMESNGTTEEEINKIIDKRVPSYTYIKQFHDGNYICINYMNTLAMFFDVKYLISNFDLGSSLA